MKKAGSAIILVFALLAVVGLIASIFIRSSSLFYSFSIDRMVHTRQILALEALAHYATARCYAMKEGERKSWEKKFFSWPPLDGSCSGEVKASYSNSETNIHVVLYKKNEPIGSIKWSMRHLKKGPEISPWRYDVS